MQCREELRRDTGTAATVPTTGGASATMDLCAAGKLWAGNEGRIKCFKLLVRDAVDTCFGLAMTDGDRNGDGGASDEGDTTSGNGDDHHTSRAATAAAGDNVIEHRGHASDEGNTNGYGDDASESDYMNGNRGLASDDEHVKCFKVIV